MYLEKAERQNFFSEKEFLEHGLQNGLEENLILGVDSKLALYRMECGPFLEVRDDPGRRPLSSHSRGGKQRGARACKMREKCACNIALLAMFVSSPISVAVASLTSQADRCEFKP
jgi:hypothetical protein